MSSQVTQENLFKNTRIISLLQIKLYFKNEDQNQKYCVIKFIFFLLRKNYQGFAHIFFYLFM